MTYESDILAKCVYFMGTAQATNNHYALIIYNSSNPLLSNF